MTEKIITADAAWGRLVLVRHGESIWNRQNRFTGWVDISLSQDGIKEAQCAGELLANEQFSVAFTSNLVRAQDTLYEILQKNNYTDQYIRIHNERQEWYENFVTAESDKDMLRIYISEKLNERYYGNLQGYDKNQAKKKFGADLIHQWRRSYDISPPDGESLAQTAARTIPYFLANIAPRIARGDKILITAHGNSLRSIIMHIEQMNSKEIMTYELTNGTPHIYTFDKQAKVINKEILTA